MSGKKIYLCFDGYWLEDDLGGTPEQSGIYCVYSCTYNQSSNTVSIKRLLYIGESGDVRGRLSNHERLPDWKRALQFGERLCFAAAKVSPIDRERAEAALIFRCQPPLNNEHTRHFIYEDTEIVTSNKNYKLPPVFTVRKTI